LTRTTRSKPGPATRPGLKTIINMDFIETSGEKNNKNMLYSTEFINQVEFIGVHSNENHDVALKS